MGEKYRQQFARDCKVVVKEEGGKRVTYIRFRGVLKYREKNNAYKERPEGTDTRTPVQRRRYVWKQVGRNLECRKGRSEQQTQKNIQDALSAWREQMEHEAQVPSDARKTTVEFVREFVEGKKNSRTGKPLAVTTRDNYNNALKLIDRKQLRKPLEELTIQDVHAWLKQLDSEGKGASITDKAFRLLKSALKSAQRRELIARNPCDFIGADEGKPVPPRAEVNALDEDGLKRLNLLLDNMGHTQMADCARLSLLCGMRQGEICGLRLKDIDGWRTGEYGDLHVRNVIVRSSNGQENKPSPKNGTQRAIYINKPMAELFDYRIGLLRQQAKAGGVMLSGEEYVFGTLTGKAGTGFYSPNYLSKVWHQFALANNIIGCKGYLCNFHSCRHTFATIMLSNGEPVVKVSQILGHRDPSVTMRIYFDYIPHGTDSTQQRAAELMTATEHQAPVEQFSPTGTDD